MHEPHPTDTTALDVLARHEPAALHAQPPVVWERAEGTRVYDASGRCWLDWTSGVLTANAGHSPDAVVEAIVAQARSGLLHTYAFPTQIRAEVVGALSELTGFRQVVLYSTGAEAVEAAVKICRTHAQAARGGRRVVVSFEGAFHGRTMGAQLAGGIAHERHWVPDADAEYLRLPFPGEGWDATALDDAVREAGLLPPDVACVIVEPYQGSTLQVLPPSAGRALRAWCTAHGALLVVDEIQSGFGRTGTLFGFEHWGIRPDLVLCGKGISGSLPVSAVLIEDPAMTEHLRTGELTSTHGGNPVALAAVRATVRLFQDGSLVSHAAAVSETLAEGLRELARTHKHVVAEVSVCGMAAGLTVASVDGRPGNVLATALVQRLIDSGLMVLSPIGPEGAMLKIAPPLVSTREELAEGVRILRAALDELTPTPAAQG